MHVSGRSGSKPGSGGRTRAETRALVLLAFVGSALILRGLWIPTKAWAAQQMIARAWSDVVAGQTQIRPWPWADTWPVARLHLPGVDAPLYVLAGASGQSLAFGPAHVSASARPGEPDNVVIAGHRDTHFAALEHLALGAEVILETATSSIRYRVDEAIIVHESRVDLLEHSGRAELTLITCYPFDSIVPGGPLRYVVHAGAIDARTVLVPIPAPPTRVERALGPQRK